MWKSLANLLSLSTCASEEEVVVKHFFNNYSFADYGILQMLLDRELKYLDTAKNKS